MMDQVTRPDQIDTILDKIDKQLPYEMGVTLEKYISKLEAHQTVDDDTFVWDRDNPPIWSQARHKERQQHRRERAERNRKAFE